MVVMDTNARLNILKDTKRAAVDKGNGTPLKRPDNDSFELTNKQLVLIAELKCLLTVGVSHSDNPPDSWSCLLN